VNNENKKTILLVEDEAIIALIEKSLLEKYGYSIIIANSGEKAIELFNQNNSIDLILMDIDLGSGIDGPETASIILKERDIPVVFLSSHTEPAVVERTERITSYGYVVKSSSITVLDASIKMAFKLFNEKTLRKHEETITQFERDQLLSIFNSIDEITYISDPKTFELIYANKTLTERIPEDSIGKKCYKILQNLDAPCDFCTNDIILKNKPESHYWNFYNTNFKQHYQIVDRIIRWPDGRDVRFEIAIDITERKRIENELIQQLKFEQAIVAASRFLLSADKSEQAVNEALKSLVDASGVSRNYIFKNFNDPEDGLCMRQVFEACSPGVQPEIENPSLQHVVYSQGFERWRKVLSSGRQIQGDVCDFPESERDILESQGIVSILIIPIDVAGQWWGFIGFDETSSQHKWKDAEMALLQTVSEIIGSFLTRNIKDRQIASLTAVVENSSNIVVLKDIDLRVVATTQAFANAAGYAAVDMLIGKTDAEIFGVNPEIEPIRSYMEDERLVQAFSPGQYIEREEPLVCADGRTLIVLTKKYPIFDSSKNLLGTGNISVDITERKIAEDKIRSLLAEKELILKEVHHRLKNNMNTVKGLLFLQIAFLKDPQAISALQDTIRRVDSMAVIYDKLYLSHNFDDISVQTYLPSLIDEIISNFPGNESVKVEKKIDDFILEVKKLQPLGIIINELLTNIMKYAFTGRDNNLISVSATLTGKKVSIIISDNGNGIPESVTFENSTGFGMQLVGMLTQQIGGSIKIERGNGTKFVLEFEI